MKLRILLGSIIIALVFACSSNTLVGRWRLSQTYNRFQEDWKTVEKDLYFEFSADGRFNTSTGGTLTSGTYNVDKTQSPNRIVFNDEKVGTAGAIFKIDGNTLTLKSFKDTKSGFPMNFDADKGEANFELVTFERK